MTSEPQSNTSPRDSQALQVVRGVIHVAVVVNATVWGFFDWAFPFPAVFVGLGALLITILIWALFLSPKPVLHTDRFGHGLIELLFLASGAGALLALGVPWWIAAAFFVVGAILGWIVPNRNK
ncbi:DUF2568 domain-containing protein [Leucobacter denitrificans]|uniref:YrdB family protein n=1 Tax=Leucobacter denitrificans TaxID=683042 RepID=A0A7G9S778_9MICO|nr:DUF2568 domain-containing protein [Leucobacter denitrificans]QNN63703.1 YrdB family protein [Leucobacter denitrificans]